MSFCFGKPAVRCHADNRSYSSQQISRISAHLCHTKDPPTPHAVKCWPTVPNVAVCRYVAPFAVNLEAFLHIPTQYYDRYAQNRFIHALETSSLLP